MSSIKQNKRECNECGEVDYIFSRGRCKRCAYISYGSISRGNRKIKPNRANFFKEQIDIIQNTNSGCQECNKPLSGRTYEVCHILDKSSYPSVGEEPSNIMFYCSDCHNEFDGYPLERHKRMKSFPTVLKRFKLFKGQVPEKEKGSMYKYLQKHLEK